MDNKPDHDRMRKLLVRGLGWCLCLLLWTIALLTVFPVEVGKTIVPSAMHFGAAKCLHVSAYAFLTAYISWLPLRRWRWLLLAFLSCHAAGTEFFQQFVPGRYGMASDVVIDHFGIALGLALTWKRWVTRFAGRNLEQPKKLEPRRHAKLTSVSDASL